MKTYLFNRFNIGIMAAGLLLLLSEGCSSDADDATASGSSQTGDSSEVVVRVPITIALGGYDEDEASSSANSAASDKGTRAAPPGAGGGSSSGSSTDSQDDGYEETKSINTVRIIAFRRKAKSDNSTNTESTDDTEGFVYDPKNDITLTTLTDESGHTDDYLSGATHKHRVAKGTFAKSQGYEYRIVALAYDTSEPFPYPEFSPYYKVINDYTTFNIGKGTTFDEFKVDFGKALITSDGGDTKGNWKPFFYGGASLFTYNIKSLSGYLASIPQLFYGTIYQKGGNTKNPIIPYSTTDSDGKNITDTPLTGTLYRGMAEVVLNLKTGSIGLANPQWYCLLADNVLTTVNLTSYDDFKHGYNTIADDKYTAIAFHRTPDKGETITLKAFLLPGKTHLAVRVSFNITPYAKNGQIKAKDVTSSDNATGVITVDALNNMFYLRRNHKYVFTYTDHSVIMDSKHELP